MELDTENTVRTSYLRALAALLAWTTLYFTLCLLNSRRSYEWHCRVVTLLHALLVVSLSAWSGFVEGPWPFTDPAGPNTAIQRWICAICLGYFVFDLSWCLYFKTEGALMLVHHGISIFGNWIILYRDMNGTEMIATIFGSELTNPLLQARWFLRETDQHHSWYGELNDGAFILLFGFLRIGVASNLIWCYLNHPRPDWIARTGGTVFYAMGWVFWLFIFRYGVRKYTKMFRNIFSRTKMQPLKEYSSKENGLNGAVSNGHLHQKEE